MPKWNRLRPPNENEYGQNSGIEIFDCNKKIVQLRKDTGEKRTFQLDSLLESGIPQEEVFEKVAIPVINVISMKS